MFNTINDRRKTNNSTITAAAEGLIRLRDEELVNSNDISKNEESLHSFQFSAATFREGLLNKKQRFHGSTLPGHYKSSDLINTTTDRFKTLTVGSPISKNHFRHKSLFTLSESPPKPVPLMEPDTALTGCTMSNSSSSSSTSQSINTPSTTEDEFDVEDEDEDDEETYVPHLHNRLKQQNQAILTTYDDWRIILTNSIAQDVLVSHLHHQMNEEQDMLLVGKSVMDLIEPSYQNRLKSIIVKRRNELKRRDADESTNTGMVLVCGNVVCIV